MGRKKRKVRIGLAQVNPTVGDLGGNAGIARRIIADAKRSGVQILAFPELFLCGYPAEDLLLKPGFIIDCEKELRKLARHATGIAVIAGAPRRSEDPGSTLRNTASILCDGKIAARYDKINLPNYGVFDEKRYFAPGERPFIASFGDTRVGISICEDIWVDDGPITAQCSNGGAEIIINISASPYHRRKGPDREKLMQRRARENNTWLCYLNLVGAQDELVFDGNSLVIDPGGSTIARGAVFREDLIIADIDLTAKGEKEGKTSSATAPGLPVGLIDTAFLPALSPHEKRRLPSRQKTAHPGPNKEIYEALVLGTRDYVDKNGFSGVIIGLSGGIDSALTATIAVDALGPERVIGVTMPSEYTSSSTLKDAHHLAENLDINIKEIPVGKLYDAYRDLLADIIPRGPVGITEENLQARIRGNILMALSNRFGHLVLTTGNKSEIAVGYCTLYGDMAGGFAVLKDVPKTLVFSLSRYRNRRAGVALIPASTIRRRPSAELRPGQLDEDSLPPYPTLDRIIELYVEKDFSLSGIISDGIAPGIAEKTVRMIDLSEYKRRQGPPGIKITPKAFGRDRRLPITNRYRRSAKIHPGGRKEKEC
ncbi:MAG: NAD+ synthase [Candidatus Krumholzibacteriota bacterium]|nr:NAD+ synthase [Candidatus Krumholzibacteriota bacterium]